MNDTPSSILSCYLIFGRQLYSPSGGTRVRYRMQQITIVPSPSSSLSYTCCDLFPTSEIDRDLSATAQRTPEHVKNAVNDHHIKLLSSLSYYLPQSIFSNQFIPGSAGIRIDFHGRRSHRRPAVEKVNHNIPYTTNTTIYFIVVTHSFFESNF